MNKYKAIIQATELLTMRDASETFEVLKEGGLIICDGKIIFVGLSKEVIKHPDFCKIDESDIFNASGMVVMPGYVDSHTHFVFAGTREEEYELRLQGANYMTIMEQGGGIINSVASTRGASFDELYELAYERLEGMIQYGVTTVEGKSGYGLNDETEIKQLQVMKQLNQDHVMDIIPTYLGAHSVMSEWKGQEDTYINHLIEESLPKIMEEKLAIFCDVFCEQGVFTIEQSRRLLLAAKELGFKITIHADEMVDLGGGALAAEVKATSADHLLAVSEESIDKMVKAKTVATLLPATAFSLREAYAPARKMIDLGLDVALATDYNPGSCPTYSIPLVIALATLNMGMTIEEVLIALTQNGAKAVGLDGKIGSLEVGKFADIIIHNVDNYKKIPYNLGMNTVAYVMKKGEFYVN